MPHAWPFTALSAAWRKRCASTDDRGIVSAIEAFVDRTPIDWPALRANVRGAHDRTLIDALQTIDTFRGPDHEIARTRESPPRHPIAWVVVALAVLQIAISVALFVPSLPAGPPLKSIVQLLLAMAFASSALLLDAGTAHDGRRILLLGFLLCAGTSFARAALTAVPGGAPDWTRVLWLDALAPACLWQFALDFPRVDRFAPFDLIARRVAAVAWTIGAVAIAANLGVMAGLVPESAAQPLLPNDPGAAFWRGYSLAAIAAIVTIFVRARRAPRDERRRVARLAASLVAGTGPFLLLGLARTAIPGFERWFREATPAARLTIDAVVIVTLLVTPLLAAAAVVLDRPFDRQQRLAQAGRRLVRRAAIWSTARHRRQLTAALRALRTAQGPREVSHIVANAMRGGLNAAAHVLSRHGDRFRGSGEASLTAPGDAAFVAMLRASPQPLNLSPAGSIHGMLPEHEREWLGAESIQMAAPIVARDGSLAAIIVAGSSTAAINLDRRDLWFAEALAAAASAVWTDEPNPPALGAGSATMDAAWECPLCGVVQDAAPLTCGCGALPALAVLPARLGGTFILRRRLGSGGMGIVYQARDVRLDRDVALKTLPAVAPRAVDGLHREARAMASLNHDALATIYGIEVWRDVPVLVCEYFPGGTLANRLARGGPLSPVDAIRLIARLARGLDYMHAIGVRHGDIKPANIGFTARGRGKLLDFGLSRLTAVDIDGGMRPVIGGTLAYLPPEALRGEPPSSSFDLWSLAMVLLECLLGRNPLARDIDALTRRAMAAADAVALTAPLRAGHAPLTAILERALGPAQERFVSAAAFARALDDLAPEATAGDHRE